MTQQENDTQLDDGFEPWYQEQQAADSAPVTPPETPPAPPAVETPPAPQAVSVDDVKQPIADEVVRAVTAHEAEREARARRVKVLEDWYNSHNERDRIIARGILTAESDEALAASIKAVEEKITMLDEHAKLSASPAAQKQGWGTPPGEGNIPPKSDEDELQKVMDKGGSEAGYKWYIEQHPEIAGLTPKEE